ncbi:hypothetical protein M2277_005076 [Paenibacillus sp. LBL]|uniref:hypothetical protein n=1 Tax=Paenibacillus sp. LBL TaxID=2940563 RepID=UPI0024748E08|nr:hypothetical protein [Paenibacillus sp. LBL]MDH6674384.1 hypothetical protein [Paenibacillus sp. LBL]
MHMHQNGRNLFTNENEWMKKAVEHLNQKYGITVAGIEAETVRVTALEYAQDCDRDGCYIDKYCLNEFDTINTLEMGINYFLWYSSDAVMMEACSYDEACTMIHGDESLFWDGSALLIALSQTQRKTKEYKDLLQFGLTGRGK